jgi:FAD/FMN-containing dehydrogenase
MSSSPPTIGPTRPLFELARGFGGTLLFPHSPGYEESRQLFNGMIDRRPAAIARCMSAGDVATAILGAREQHLPLSVYGAGHGVAGHAVRDGGVMIDLRTLGAVEVDPDQRVAKVQGAATWAAIDAATQRHRLAVTGGRVSSTGVGGLTLGGGSGWLERRHGLTCDNLTAAEIVTADGRILRASPEEHPDLFWGLRGGGGNFGVVTRFDLLLHPVGPDVLGGTLAWPIEMAGEVLRCFRDYMPSAPDPLGAAVCLPVLSAGGASAGKPGVGVMVCWSGPLEDAAAALAPFHAVGPPQYDLTEPLSYLNMQRSIDDGAPFGMRNYWSADYVRDLTDPVIDSLVEVWRDVPSPMSKLLVLGTGGEIGRVSDAATAIGWRDSAFSVHAESRWASPADDETNVSWARRTIEITKPLACGGAYLNFIGDEGPERVRTAYRPDQWERLVALKARWDPDNVFDSNQNIPPVDRK